METLQLKILEHLDPERFDAVVVVAEFQRQAAARFRECLDAIDVPLLTVPDTRALPVVSGLLRIWKLRGLLRGAGIDVVHIQTRTPEASRRLTLAAFLARTPALIRTEHVSPGPHVGRWTRYTVVPFDWMTDLIITDSKADRDEQIRLVGRAPEKVATSYCGIDPFAFDEHHDIAAAKRALGIDPTSVVIGTVGRLHEQKGHRYLVAAAGEVLRHCPATVLLLVGDGPDEAALRQQVADEGIADRVIFAGFQADPVPYMEAMDVAVMPSLWEGFSISMQEFMAMGTPLVTSDHHSFREAMDHGVHGLIAPMRDSAQLAVEIERLVLDADLRATIGAAAAHRARQEFSIQRHVDELMAMYDQVLARR